MKTGLQVLNGAVFVCVGQDCEGYYFRWGRQNTGEQIRLSISRRGKVEVYYLKQEMYLAVFSNPPEKPR